MSSLDSKLVGRGADQYTVRFPEGMRDVLKKAAAANGRSINSEIVARLAESLLIKEPPIEPELGTEEHFSRQGVMQLTFLGYAPESAANCLAAALGDSGRLVDLRVQPGIATADAREELADAAWAVYLNADMWRALDGDTIDWYAIIDRAVAADQWADILAAVAHDPTRVVWFRLEW